MKVKVIKDAFYHKAIIRAGSITDIDFKKNDIPSWAVAISADKKNENSAEKKTSSENTTNENSAEILEKLKDIAIENEIYINVNPDDTIVQSINKFQNILKQKGIEY